MLIEEVRAVGDETAGVPWPSDSFCAGLAAIGLLRGRCQRPSRSCAAQQRDELAPFHWPASPVLPNKKNSTQGAAAQAHQLSIRSAAGGNVT